MCLAIYVPYFPFSQYSSSDCVNFDYFIHDLTEKEHLLFPCVMSLFIVFIISLFHFILVVISNYKFFTLFIMDVDLDNVI